jgi:gas vesicle protein
MKKLILSISILLTAYWAMASIAPTFASETVKGAEKDYQSFKEDMTHKLNDLEAQINEIKEKTKSHSSDVSEKTTHELESARDKIKAQLKDLKSDTDGSWKKLKKGIADSMNSLNEKVQKTLNN